MSVYPHKDNFKDNLENLCKKSFNQSAKQTIVYNYDYPEKTAAHCLCKGTWFLYNKLYLGRFKMQKENERSIENLFNMTFEQFVDIVTNGFEYESQSVEERISGVKK